jgi:hypothetical protein
VSVEVLDHAIVGHEIKLVVGKGYRQKVRARVIIVCALSYTSGGGGAVVSISDVERVELSEGAEEPLLLRALTHRPELMAHAVLSDKINARLARGDLADEGVDGGLSTVGEEHRAEVSAEALDEAHTVLLFTRQGELVAFDLTCAIVGSRGEANEPYLAVEALSCLHVLSVGIVLGRRALKRPTLDQALKLYGCSIISLW